MKRERHTYRETLGDRTECRNCGLIRWCVRRPGKRLLVYLWSRDACNWSSASGPCATPARGIAALIPEEVKP